MKCPKCQHGEDKVLETRSVREGEATRRRRECAVCQHRFTTYEYVERASLDVLKKDGRREPFQREKVGSGVARACEKRPVSRATIEEVLDSIERDLFRSGEGEVPAAEIGRRVMDALKALDPVAYVRFASVYLNFNDIQQFIDTIQELPAHDRGET